MENVLILRKKNQNKTKQPTISRTFSGSLAALLLSVPIYFVFYAYAMQIRVCFQIVYLSIQIFFNSIQFNSIYFPSKQQTHLKNTQDGGDATKSKSLKNVAPSLQLKTTTNKKT